jgi:predicted RNase H-like HicB family nuclease
LRVIALVHKDEGSSYGVSFPDFPGCVSGGETLDEALTRASEAVNAHVAWLVRDGDTVPAPRALEQIRSDPELADDLTGAMPTIVSVFVPGGHAQRVDVTLDGDLLEDIDRAAVTFPGGRSGFLAEAAREKLTRAV